MKYLAEDLLWALQRLEQEEVCLTLDATPARVISSPELVDGRCVVAHLEAGGWGALARYLSACLPGQWWRGDRSLCWIYGPYQCWLLEESDLDEVRDARDLVRKITRAGWDEVPWTVAACARFLLQWTGLTQACWRQAEEFGLDVDEFYVYCDPGDFPFAYNWDISSCYYTIISRMPSPIVFIEDGDILFSMPDKEKLARWRTVIKRIRKHKKLRNSLYGSMVSGKGECFSKGAPLWDTSGDRKKAGLLRPAAQLAVRTAYELCCRARIETGARFAYTDCIIAQNQKTAPKVWLDAGFKVSLKGRGKAEIYTPTCVRCGEHETAPYRYGKYVNHWNGKRSQWWLSGGRYERFSTASPEHWRKSWASWFIERRSKQWK